ncbi:hypothetical protein D3C87_64690 [compost metagenome]
MEEHAERLFELIESKSFKELNREEKAFVLSHLTEQEFILQRQVIAASAALEYDVQEPYSLQIPKEKKSFLNKTIPLYQAFIGAACLVLLFIFAGNRNNYTLNWRFPENPLEISLTNGASSVQIIHDTIVKEIPGLRSASGIIHDTITIVQNVLQQPEKHIPDVSRSLIYPELTGKLLESKSVALKEDETAQLLLSNPPMNPMK